jgi:hypothetical protein
LLNLSVDGRISTRTLKKSVGRGVDMIYLAKHRDKQQNLVKALIKLRGSIACAAFSTADEKLIASQQRTSLCGVRF